VIPQPVLTSVSVTLRNKLSETMDYSGSLGWTSHGVRGTLGVTWKRPTATVGAQGSWDGETALVRLTYAYGARGGQRVARGGTGWAKVRTRVFLDHDEDGKFTPGDQPLTDVPVYGIGRTDEQGYVEKTVPSGQRVIRVKEDLLVDPRWYDPRAVRVVVRPGGLAETEVPVRYRSLK
jgi:hypothetical protein